MSRRALLTAGFLLTARLPAGTPLRAEAPQGTNESRLPSLGSESAPLPAGAGKNLALASCSVCHSTEMLRQQRLSRSQWTAELNKMIGWGARVAPQDKAVLLDYLAKRFGPANSRFRPLLSPPSGE